MILAASLIFMLNYKGINNKGTEMRYPFIHGQTCMSKVVTVRCYNSGNRIKI